MFITVAPPFSKSYAMGDTPCEELPSKAESGEDLPGNALRISSLAANEEGTSVLTDLKVSSASSRK